MRGNQTHCLFITKNGAETTIIKKRVGFTPNQKALLSELEFPRKFKTLYRILKPIMPESSVRRIMYTLENEGLVEKHTTGMVTKWRKVK